MELIIFIVGMLYVLIYNLTKPPKYDWRKDSEIRRKKLEEEDEEKLEAYIRRIRDYAKSQGLDVDKAEREASQIGRSRVVPTKVVECSIVDLEEQNYGETINALRKNTDDEKDGDVHYTPQQKR
ncbi:MAG: hypothetical protein IJK58_02310 [Clostridia bacterium]|nr:hypothetical protein [Clostridia bacterium]